MADARTTELTALGATPDLADLVPIVDVDASELKKATVAELLAAFQGAYDIMDGVPGTPTAPATLLYGQAPRAFTINSAAASVGTAPSGGPVTITVHKNGVQVASITIADEATSGAGVSFPVSFAQDDVVEVKLDAINGAVDLRYRLTS